MLSILREISITCFFTSYAVVLGLELSRLIGRVPGRVVAAITFMALGLFTHVTYLSLRAGGFLRVSSAEPAVPNHWGEAVVGDVITADWGREIGRLATWTDWSLLLALGLAVCFLVMYVRRPDTIVGLFFLPAVLLLIALAVALRDQPPFSRGQAFQVWRLIHALGMATGSAIVIIGFLGGVMYLVQSRRLKRKRAGGFLRLPTLESLQNLSRGCLLSSTVAVGIGVAAGVVMNLNRWGQVGWTDGGVLLSGAMFVWLLLASLFEMVYAPARRGRKIAYLTLASFGFLVLVMFAVLRSSHGVDQPDVTQRTSQSTENRLWLPPPVGWRVTAP